MLTYFEEKLSYNTSGNILHFKLVSYLYTLTWFNSVMLEYPLLKTKY